MVLVCGAWASRNATSAAIASTRVRRSAIRWGNRLSSQRAWTCWSRCAARSASSLRFGEIASDDPWDGATLEWSIASPPPIYNFDEIPRVVGGPYEFGIPGAKHAIMAGETTTEGAEVPAGEKSTVGTS